jgi:hypothetical protein
VLFVAACDGAAPPPPKDAESDVPDDEVGKTDAGIKARPDGDDDAPVTDASDAADATDASDAAGVPITPLAAQLVLELNFKAPVDVVAVGDFDGDGIPDVVGAPRDAPFGLVVVYGKDNKTFEDPVAIPIADSTGPVKSLVAADLNYDQVPDVVAKPAAGGPFAFTASKTRTFTPRTVDVSVLGTAAVLGPVLTTPMPNGLVYELLDGNTTVATLEPDEAGNLKARPTTSALVDTPPATPPIVAVGDIDGDGYPDLITVEPNASVVHTNHGHPDGSFDKISGGRKLSAPARGLSTADLDGDGKWEIVVAEATDGGPDHLEVLKDDSKDRWAWVQIALLGDADNPDIQASTIGAQPQRGADLAFEVPGGVAYLGEKTKGGEIGVREERIDLTDAKGVVHQYQDYYSDTSGAPDFIVEIDPATGGSLVRGYDTGAGPPPCPSLFASAPLVDPKTLTDVERAAIALGRAIQTPEIGAGLCVTGRSAPFGEVAISSPGGPGHASGVVFVDTIHSSGFEVVWTQGQVDHTHNHSILECGQGAYGFTVCPTPKNVVPPGEFVIVEMTQAGKIPLADPTNYFQLAAVFDADGDASNNYVPLAAYPKDFFKDTDRWYEADYVPGMGWKLKVSTAHGMTITPVTDSAARIVISDNTVYFMIPRSELPAAKLGYRVTAFRHKGDYGLKPPYDWDANITPPVDTPLATVP